MTISINLNKTTPNQYVIPNQVINYTININNTGTIDIYNLSFLDTLDPNQSYVLGSTKINNVPKPLLNPTTGFTLDDLLSGTSTQISYSSKILGTPPNNNATNTASLNYSYIPSQGQNPINTTSYTNTVTLPIVNTNPTLTKIAPSYVDVDNSPSYQITLVVDNTSPPNNRDLENAIVKDVLSPSLVFVPNSIEVNGNPISGDINTGVNIGTVPVGTVSTLTFNVIVPNIPFTNPILNSGELDYNFHPYPGGAVLPNTIISNEVSLQVNHADLSKSLKVQSREFSDINTPITYEISVPNDGNITALNVMILDTLPSGVSLVPNSVFLNGVLQPGSDPQSGVLVGDIPPGSSKILVFQVVANSIPTPNPYVNKGVIDYSHIIDPTTTPVNEQFETNGVTQDINSAILFPINKTSSEAYGNLGDVITYTVFFQNTGNTTADNLVFTDVPPLSTVFLNNSLMVNGVTIPGENPGNGIAIGTLLANEGVTITFQVLVDKLPQSNPILNTANTSFSYDIGGGNIKNSTLSSQTVATTIVYASIFGSNFPKAVDITVGDVGDSVTYTITLKNTGNTTALNILVLDTVPNGTTFIPNSVTIDGAITLGVDPNLGVTIPFLAPNSTAIISFKVMVNTLPNPNPMENTGNVIYNYVVDPSLPEATSSQVTNRADTQINTAEIQPSKTASPEYADVGETITYTITGRVIGNTTATNIYFQDNISQYLNYNQGSVTIDGVNYTGLNPQVGFSLPDMVPGASFTITFSGIANGIPPSGTIPNIGALTYQHFISPDRPLKNHISYTNEAETQIRNADVSGTNFNKYGPPYVITGDTIPYTLTAYNSGNASANNVFISDAIPPYTTFVPGSVIVNGINCLTCNPNPGFYIDTIPPGGTSKITFSVVVDQSVPNGTILVNTANINYSYIVDPTTPETNKSSSASSSTQVVDQGDNFIYKYVDKTQASLNDILNYTILFRNGPNTLDNIVFQDTIPNYTTFEPNSLNINGVNYPGLSPNIPITITSIPAYFPNTITFQVQVTTIPKPNPISNNGTIGYSYTNGNGDIFTGSFGTNKVNTYVNNPSLVVTKSESKSYSDIGDEITYTIVLNNNGNIQLNNLNFNDIITLGATQFKSNSLYINGINQPGVNPFSGIVFPTLNYDNAITITFTQIVQNLPLSNVITNQGNVNYNYTNMPNGATIPSSAISNIVTTTINHGDITNNKFPNKQYSSVSDVLTFTSVITSTGNTTVDNLFFQDTLPNGTSFIPGTVVINGVTYGSYDPEIGFNLNPSLPPGANYTVAFSVNVDSLPSPNPLVNISSVDYSYVVNPTIPSTNNRRKNSTPAVVNIVDAKLSQEKITDSELSTIGDTITYTIKTTNTGNVPTALTVANDQLSPSLLFIPGSVIIDGVTSPSANPLVGINLDTVPVGSSVTITFKAKVISLPTINPITNTANASFRYTIDPLYPNEGYGYGESNGTPTEIKAAIINSTKSVDLNIADLGSTLNYVILVSNNGNVDATNTIFQDVLQNEISLVPGSLMYNGSPLAGDMYTGIPLGIVPAQANYTITFKVKVNTIPNPNVILNTGNFNYQYIYDITKPAVVLTTPTNQVQTIINNANFLTINKSVDKTLADVGDTLTYTTTFKNLGNVVAQNVVFRDTIPNDTSFVQGSVLINNSPCNSCTLSSGIPLSNVAPGELVTVTFKVTVLTIPNPNPIPNQSGVDYRYRLSPQNALTTGSNYSNVVNTQINHGDITILKTVDKNKVDIGDVVVYTLSVKNTGNVTVFNSTLTDIIQSGTTFIPNSLSINNVSLPSYDPNTGVTLPDLASNGVTTITFSVITNTIPNPNPFLNKGEVDFSYIVDPSLPNVNGNATSNLTSVKVNHGELSTSKKVSESYGALNDTLTYTIFVENTGSVRLDNMILIDTLPQNTTFVPNSIVVNGVVQGGLDINSGVTLDPLFPGDGYTITFKAIVTTVPTPNVILNNGTINSTYIVDPSIPSKKVDRVTNQVQTIINTVNLSTIVKNLDKTIATFGDTITYTINFLVTGNTTANNLVFYDTIPPGTIFETGTASINNSTFPISNPQFGVNFGNVSPVASVTIGFKVLVVSIPTPNPTPNTGSVSYNYNVDPSLPNRIEYINSNTVNTLINHADLFDIKKGVDKTVSDINEAITYTLTIPNTGNISATDVFLIDVLSNDSNLIPGSIYIDGVNYPNLTTTNSIPLGTIPGGGTKVVKFSVQATKIPNPNPIPNDFSVNYNFSPYPNTIINDNAYSNTVYTQINSAILSINKGVDKTLATYCDDLTYTIVVNNSGNLTAESVVIQDTIPLGESLIPNSIKINNMGFPGSLDYLPIYPIPPNSTTTITFKVKINNCIPPNNLLCNQANLSWRYVVTGVAPYVYKNVNSNMVCTLVQQDPYSFSKVVSFNEACPSEEITYYFTIYNSFKYAMEEVTLIDSIPNGTTFIPNSLIVNGMGILGSTLPKQINIGTIYPSSESGACFKVRVNQCPEEKLIKNSATINFNTIIGSSTLPNLISASSNEVYTYVSESSIENPLVYECNKGVSLHEVSINGIVKQSDLLRSVGLIIKKYRFWKEFLINTTITPPERMKCLSEVTLGVEIVDYSINYGDEKCYLVNCNNKITSLNNILIIGNMIITLEYYDEYDVLSITRRCQKFSTYISLSKEFNCKIPFNIKGVIEDSYVALTEKGEISLKSSLLIYLSKDGTLKGEPSRFPIYSGISTEKALKNLSCSGCKLWNEGVYEKIILVKHPLKEILNISLNISIKKYKISSIEVMKRGLDCKEVRDCEREVFLILSPLIKVRYLDDMDALRSEEICESTFSEIITLPCGKEYLGGGTIFVENMMVKECDASTLFLSAIYFLKL